MPEADSYEALRGLPSVDSALRKHGSRLENVVDAGVLVRIIRDLIDATRADIIAGKLASLPSLDSRIDSTLQLLMNNDVRTVINATGVIIHTNLGRSPVSQETAAAMSAAACNYLPLEVRLGSGERGGRGEEVQILLNALTGAESALVVNNNAAAILLTLSALCRGKRVLISRGEAVEIGGGFRIPDVMRQSGSDLVEVGTTNRTNLADYAENIDEETAAILTVHASNFEISGFTHKPRLADLAALAHNRGILLIEDVGSGCLVETAAYGLDHEPTLEESITAGVDVVTASGDKLLGGPQAGLILGTSVSVDQIRRHPLARAVRTGKSVQAGVAATLRHYVRGEQDEKVPIWWMMSRTVADLRARAASWQADIGSATCEVVETTSVTGGGSLPGKSQPSAGLSIQAPSMSAGDLSRRLRLADRSVFPRIEEDRVILDARTVLPGEDQALIETVRDALAQSVR